MISSSLPPHLTSSGAEEVHLTDYLRVLWRRRRIFSGTFLAILLTISLYTFLTRPIFEASASLYVKDEKSKGGVLGELALLNSANPIDAEIEILKSRTNAEQVVKRLHLDWVVKEIKGSPECQLVEFVIKDKTPSFQVKLGENGSYQILDPQGQGVGIGQVGDLFTNPRLTLLIGELRGRSGDLLALSKISFNRTVANLKNMINANEVGKKTNIIRVSTMSTNPVGARDIVNTLVQVYLDQSVSFKTEEATRTVKFVDEQVTTLRNDLNSAENSLQEYKSSNNLVKLDSEAEELIHKFSETEKERAAVHLQSKLVEFALTSLHDASRRGVVYSPAVMGNDPLVAEMAGKLADLEIQKSALLESYTRDHLQVRTVQEQIDEILRKIAATYETALRNFSQQERDISQRIATYETELKKLPVAERDLARLTRIAKVNADIYVFLLQKYEEARIVKASTISNISVVDPAITPDDPIKPQKKKNLLLGLLLGLMAGAGLAFFQEYLDDTVKDAEQAKNLLALPVLGTIPHIPVESVPGLLDDKETLIALNEPKSAAAESFRSLRTGIHFAAVNRKQQTILLTSTFPGEGKSTVAANLAIAIAQTGAKILLIDCDLRRPSLHIKFAINKVPGITDLLAVDTLLDHAIHHDVIPGLDCICAGTISPNPSELLGSEGMEALLAELRGRYDQIIIDAPPVLAVTDAPVLTSYCDMVVVIMEAGRVPARAAQRMQEMLAAVQAPVSGLVFNDKTGRGDSYSYYGYGYGYGYGSADHETMKSRSKWSLKRLFKF